MKKLALPLAAIALALSLSVLWRPAAAQPPNPGWEYRVFRLDPVEYSNKADYRQLLDREGARNVDSAFKEHVLNHLGKAGWEFVDMELRPQNLTYFYLKRRKT